MEGLLEVCSSMLDSRQYDKVIKCCDDYLKMRPRSGMAWYIKGIAHEKNKEIAEADECFLNGIKADPSEPRNYYARGMLRYNVGEFEDALRLFQISNLLKLDVESLFMIALCCIMLGRKSEAQRALRAAIELDRKRTAAVAKRFFNRIYRDRKDVPEREKKALKAAIERLLKLKP